MSLQIVEHRRIWEERKFTSLLEYAQDSLGLSYDNASTYSRVARKALEVPELYEAIASRKLSVATARRIVAVIKPENGEAWIEKAATLKQRELQHEIAKDNPRAARPDRLNYVAEDALEIQGALSEEAAKVLQRVQEVESQLTKKHCNFNDAILAMGKKDPIKKAERNIGKKPIKKSDVSRRRVPSQTNHALMLRDDAQCIFVHPETGKRCEMRKWLSTHHHREWAQGGGHELDNLGLYCDYHHRVIHRE